MKLSSENKWNGMPSKSTSYEKHSVNSLIFSVKKRAKLRQNDACFAYFPFRQFHNYSPFHASSDYFLKVYAHFNARNSKCFKSCYLI